MAQHEEEPREAAEVRCGAGRRPVRCAEDSAHATKRAAPQLQYSFVQSPRPAPWRLLRRWALSKILGSALKKTPWGNVLMLHEAPERLLDGRE